MRIARQNDKGSCRASVAAKSMSSPSVYEKKGTDQAYRAEL